MGASASISPPTGQTRRIARALRHGGLAHTASIIRAAKLGADELSTLKMEDESLIGLDDPKRAEAARKIIADTMRNPSPRELVARFAGDNLGADAFATASPRWEADFAGARELLLSDNALGPDGAAHVIRRIRAAALASLVSLNVSDNALGARGLSLLGALVAEAPALTTLGAARNDGGARGVSELAQAGLAASQALRSLDLSGNACGDDGAVAVGRALLANPTLTRLRLEGNGVGERGAAALASAISTAPKAGLANLSLARNELGAAGGRLVLDALERNAQMTWLNLSHNGIDGGATRSIARTLRYNRSVEVLNLSDNPLGDECARGFAESFRGNPVLRRLHLNNCAMGADVLLDLRALSSRQAKLHIVAVVPGYGSCRR